ncbi:MAG TPA: hypothetical protein VGE17_00640 [Methylophilus sp.]
MARQTLRTALLATALLSTLAAVWWVDRQEEDAPATAAPVSEATSPARTGAPVQDVTAASVPTAASIAPVPRRAVSHWERPSVSAQLVRPLFTAQAWLPPPPKPLPPPPPTAPVLPFTYVGTFEGMPEGKTVVLMLQSKLVMAALNSTIGQAWQLDREDAHSVYFTYLPLRQKVVLSKQNTAGGARARAASMAAQEFNPDEAPNQPSDQ